MQTPQKRAIFVVAQKGGVGKSFFTRGLVQLYRDAQIATAAYDADGAVGQLMQYYGRFDDKGDPIQDPVGGAGFFDVRNPKQRDGLVNAIETGAEVILIDMPGGSVGELGKVLGTPRALFDLYVRSGYEVIVVVVISVLKASIATVMDVVDMFGDSAKYVVVKNRGTGGSPTAEDFRVYDGYDNGLTSSEGVARKMVEQHGGETIVMQEMQAETIQWLDEFDYSFAEGRTVQRGSLAHSERIHRWLESLKEAISRGPLSVKESATVSRAS